MKTTTDDRSLLNRQLFLACRSYLLNKHGAAPEDGVRALRESCCYYATRSTRGAENANTDYSTLSLVELREAIDYARGRKKPQKEMASEQARRMLVYSALYCAIHLIDYGLTFTYNRKPLTGDALKQLFMSLFQRREQLPGNVYLFLRNQWINRKFNELLCQGGFRGGCKFPEKFYDNSLTDLECQYLTTRFKLIQQNLPPLPPASVPEISTN